MVKLVPAGTCLAPRRPPRRTACSATLAAVGLEACGACSHAQLPCCQSPLVPLYSIGSFVCWGSFLHPLTQTLAPACRNGPRLPPLYHPAVLLVSTLPLLPCCVASLRHWCSVCGGASTLTLITCCGSGTWWAGQLCYTLSAAAAALVLPAAHVTCGYQAAAGAASVPQPASWSGVMQLGWEESRSAHDIMTIGN